MRTPGAHIFIGHTFLVRVLWGRETNLKLKPLMLGHLFAHRDEAWLHVAPATSCPKTLGAFEMPDETLDLETGAVAIIPPDQTRLGSEPSADGMKQNRPSLDPR